MKIYTAPGETYIVTSSSGCDVTTDTGVLIKTCAAGQDYFTAMTDATMLSDDAATVTVATGEVLAMLGGGSGGEGESYVLTAEAVKEVVPINWDGQPIYGSNAKFLGVGGFTVAVGWSTRAHQDAVTVGAMSSSGIYSVMVGKQGSAANYATSVGAYTGAATAAVTVGSRLVESVDGTNVTRTCKTEGTGSITIGAGANTLNTTASDGTVTESSNAVTIGCKASNSGADSVVLGASSSNAGAGNVVIGGDAVAKGTRNVNIGYKTNKMTGSDNVAIGYYTYSGESSVSIGPFATTYNNGVSLGRYAYSSTFGVALGNAASAVGLKAVAIGSNAKVSDYGATVIRSTAKDGTVTQLYFSGANTPLATTYEGGAPMLGYTVTDSAGNVTAAGTRSLLDLLTNNSTFAPATVDENGGWVMPTVFHPSDLDLPIEEPTEPSEEEYTPLPVYPIVEPEIDDTNP